MFISRRIGESLLIGEFLIHSECPVVERYVERVTIIWGDAEIC